MARIIDITDKLDFDSKPKLIIKGVEIEVKADAPTMLKVLSLVNDNAGVDDIVKAYEIIFPESSRTLLDNLNLSFKDLTTVISCAIKLIQGEEKEGN